MRKNNESLTFEQMMTNLEKCVSELDKGGVPLDKATEIYEEAMKMATLANTKLAGAELKITNIKDKYRLKNKDYILITLHRPSNVDDPANLEQLITSLDKVAKIAHCLWPVHPSFFQRLVQVALRIFPVTK